MRNGGTVFIGTTKGRKIDGTQLLESHLCVVLIRVCCLYNNSFESSLDGQILCQISQMRVHSFLIDTEPNVLHEEIVDFPMRNMSRMFDPELCVQRIPQLQQILQKWNIASGFFQYITFRMIKFHSNGVTDDLSIRFVFPDH